MGPFATSLERYRAMIEYLDWEIGRLLAGVNLADVTVLVLSDNGPQNNVLQWPNTAGKSKFTAYRGGIETTMIAAGYAVNRAIAGGKNTAGQVLSGHAHVVDIYRTALRICPGPDPGGWPVTDSLPLYSLTGQWLDGPHGWNFTERAEPLGVTPGGPYTDLSRAVEEIGYKAVWSTTTVELFDVWDDPWETVDLLADGVSAQEQAVLDGLTARLTEIGL